jgi:hypothetical protein
MLNLMSALQYLAYTLLFTYTCTSFLHIKDVLITVLFELNVYCV